MSWAVSGHGKQPEHDGTHDFNSVWEIDYDGLGRRSGDHPTQKPVEIFARPMRKHTQRGDSCFEPFSGSGTQLIGAEQFGPDAVPSSSSPPGASLSCSGGPCSPNASAPEFGSDSSGPLAASRE